MATVYLAHDRELERLVAVKALERPDRRTATDADDRFRREALTVARLSHPHVVGVFDAGEDEGEPFIVMEYVEGDGLDAMLGGEAPLDRRARARARASRPATASATPTTWASSTGT